ncbi:MAG TPA: trypsin-like peptidase domain-containing protein [Candidatus Saccharimonadales bacterium]|nr:trypsin-like peptidase domain-containing protein [Candidatus Saccharimonadales bacterium]
MAEQQQEPGIQGTNHSGSSFSAYAHRPPKQASAAKLRFLGVALVVVISASAGFLGGWLGNSAKDDSGADNITKQQVVLKTQGQLISNIAKEVGESVVSVEVTSTADTTDSFWGFQGTTEQESAGTGIIISKEGLILTNRHVVPAGTTNVDVTLSDGTKFTDVEVIGRTTSSDPLDVAFLKVRDTQGKELRAATIGKSSEMKVGDPVVAIGNALGQFQNTVTSGIISGFGRSVQASGGRDSQSENLENLFQTDAAINEGNSGGPLVNLEGEVIGINTAVAGGDAQNIGFSIPIDDVAGLIKSVSEKGKLERPFLGVVFVPITADMAKQYDLGVGQGAYIPPSVMIGQDAIVDGGPADKAGIEEGDVITKVGSAGINETHSLTSLLSKYNVGDRVTLTIHRDGKDHTTDVTLGTAPTE